MLRSKRFLLAAALLLTLLSCYACRAMHRRGIAAPPEPQPVQTAAQTQTETSAAAVTTQTQPRTSAAASTVTTETEPVLTEPASAMEPCLPEWKSAELREKTAELSAELGDFVGWLFMADSEIDYPVMQGSDNFYYLDHAPDGRYLKRGSIFLDYQNARDFSDPHSILFGHNMEYGMFGDIRFLKDKAVFDQHRYAWIFTPDTVYRIEFFALVFDSARGSLYAADLPQEEWIRQVRSHALYDTGAEIMPEDRLIALSTCSWASGDDRTLLTGRIAPAEEQP